MGLAISTLIRDNVEKSAIKSGYTADEATIKGLRAAFWSCSGFLMLGKCIGEVLNTVVEESIQRRCLWQWE